MSNNKIRVLVVDDSPDTRSNIRKLLQFEQGIEIVGEAADGAQAIEAATELTPDCVLMDINMPGTDGIKATEVIHNQLAHTMIIIMSVQGEQEYLRKAMLAGARDFLTKPFSGDELVNTIHQIYQGEQRRQETLQKGAEKKDAKVIVVFGAKGGVGKSTISTNLAVALSKLEQEVALFDLDLQFGDIAILLNLTPRATIADWAQDDQGQLSEYLVKYKENIRVLAAPDQPEEGEVVDESLVARVLTQLKQTVDYVIVDTPPVLDERVLQSFEQADEILLVANPDLPNLKNLRRLLELLEKLSLEKQVRVVLNRYTQGAGLSIEEVDKHIPLPLWQKVPSEDLIVTEAANQGVPFVESHPRAKVSQAIEGIAKNLLGVDQVPKKGWRFPFWR